MRPSRFIVPTLLLSTATAGLAACAGDDTNPALLVLQDASVPADATRPPPGNTPDAGGTDATDDAQPDALPDAGPKPLVAGPGVVIKGVTTDGFVIYVQNDVMSAIPLAGGTPIVISPNDGVNDIALNRVLGHDVMYFNGSGGPYEVGLSVWTSASGSKELSSSGVHAWNASPDGTKVVWGDNYNTPPMGGDVMIENADGTGRATAAAGDTLLGAAFWFTSKDDLLFQRGELLDGGGLTRLQTLSVFPSSGLPKRDLAMNVTFPAVDDPSGQWVVTSSVGQAWDLTSIATGQVTSFSDALGETGTAFFDATGATFFYAGEGGELVRIDTTNLAAPPVAALVGGFQQFFGFSPDGKFILFGEECTFSTDSSRTFCVLEAMTSAPTNTQYVTIRTLADAVFDGDRFTADSQNVLLAVPTDANTLAPEPLYAVPMTAGAPPVALSSAAWVDSLATQTDGVGWQGWRGRYAALTGSKVLVAEALPPLDQPTSIALRIVDATGELPTTTLASDVDRGGFFLSADGALVAYVSMSDQPGLYVVPAK